MKNLLLLIAVLSVVATAHSQNTDFQSPPVEKNRIIKTDFFAPITGNLSFGYEQALKNSITLDGTLGIIGIGIGAANDELHGKGIFLKAGPKFYFSPDYTFDGLHRTNDFQGAYFKPEIIYSGFGFDYQRLNQSAGTIYTDRGTNHSLALMLNFGKQWVLAHTVTLEMYGGIGYGGSMVNAPDAYNSTYYMDESELVPYKFSHFQWDNSVPIAIQAGLNIGFMIK